MVISVVALRPCSPPLPLSSSPATGNDGVIDDNDDDDDDDEHDDGVICRLVSFPGLLFVIMSDDNSNDDCDGDAGGDDVDDNDAI